MAETGPQTAGDAAYTPRAVRVTFSYRGDHIDVVDVQRVVMFVPPGDAPAHDTQSGFWLELRDRRGDVVHRQIMDHPMSSDYEVFPADGRGPIVRQPVARREGAFTVVVPDTPDAETLALMGSAPAAWRSGAAREMVRFDMESLLRRAEGAGEP